MTQLKRIDLYPKNEYSVPARQWGKWTTVARHVFNKTYGSMMANPDFFKHPKADFIPDEHFKTTAWNAAFEAACICTRGEIHLIDVIRKEVRGKS